MLRKLSFGTSGNVNNKEKVKSLKQTTSKSLSSAPDDDLDDVAVISNPTQAEITYGSSRGSITAINAPKIVPGIITSSGTGLIIQKSNQFEPNKFKGGPIKYSSIYNQTHLHSNQITTKPDEKKKKEENEEEDDELIG